MARKSNVITAALKANVLQAGIKLGRNALENEGIVASLVSTLRPFFITGAPGGGKNVKVLTLEAEVGYIAAKLAKGTDVTQDDIEHGRELRGMPVKKRNTVQKALYGAANKAVKRALEAADPNHEKKAARGKSKGASARRTAAPATSATGAPLPIVKASEPVKPTAQGIVEHVRRATLDLEGFLKRNPAPGAVGLAFVAARKLIIDACIAWEAEEATLAKAAEVKAKADRAENSKGK